MSIFLSFSHHSRKYPTRGLLCAVGFWLLAMAVGAAFEAAAGVLVLGGAALALWQSVKCVCQALAVLHAARAAGYTPADCGLCLPTRVGAPVVFACAAAALAFRLLFPARGGAGGLSLGAGLAFALLRLCVLAPLAEELIFRGAVQGALGEYGSAAVLAQAAAFALMHASAEQKLYALVMGLLLGLLRERTGSVMTGCALHSLNNILVFVIYKSSHLF